MSYLQFERNVSESAWGQVRRSLVRWDIYQRLKTGIEEEVFFAVTESSVRPLGGIGQHSKEILRKMKGNYFWTLIYGRIDSHMADIDMS